MNATLIWNNQHVSQSQHRASKANGVAMNLSDMDAFLRAEQKQAYAMAMMNTKNADDAMDVIQECMTAFVSAYSHKPRTEWRPLFYRILQNKITDHHRKQMGWRRFFVKQPDESTADEPADHTTDPLDISLTHEMGNQMIEIIQDLPMQQRQALLLRHWQQMSVKETAEVMGIGTGSVKTHLHRATQKIKQLMEQNHA